jgi:hypothetical protein
MDAINLPQGKSLKHTGSSDADIQDHEQWAQNMKVYPGSMSETVPILIQFNDW